MELYSLYAVEDIVRAHHVDEHDREAQEDIERFGCSVMHIAAEGKLPPFAFSVGITRTSTAPEVVVIGLKEPIAHFVVNEYNRRVRAGAVIQPGVCWLH
jgi:hypothetical protein